MKYILFFLGMLVIFSLSVCSNAYSDMTEMKVKTDLDEMISRVLPKDEFLVQVFTSYETVSERKLQEGETITQNSMVPQEVIVPPLPGFQPNVAPPVVANPQQSRQVYRMVDREVLKSLAVNITLNESIEAVVVGQVRTLAQSYLKTNYGSKAAVAFNSMKMLGTPKKAHLQSEWNESLPWILLAVLLSVFLLLVLFRIFGKSRPRTVYPTVVHPFEEQVESGPVISRPSHSMVGGEKKPLALPAGNGEPNANFPALPATRDFVDRRSELLGVFLENSEIFRIYFSKLAEASKKEIYAGLRGPAFESLLETLEIALPLEGAVSSPPSEDQLLFYLKNFDEFIQAQHWQHDQFFGFLRQLTTDQLTSLVRQENPLVGAMIVKFAGPDQSAKVLCLLTSSERVEILSQFSRIQSLATEELRSIEENVRKRVEEMPKLLLGYNREDVEFWSRILSQADDQAAILLDLEKSRPDLYPHLAKYRFKLEDIPSLPHPLISGVLNEVDNEELAFGLVTCPKDIVDFVVNELGPNRRQLLKSQLVTLHGISNDKTQLARKSLTLRFREAMV